MDEDIRQHQYEYIRERMLENLAAQGIAPSETTDEHHDLRRIVNDYADGPGDARVYTDAELDDIAADQPLRLCVRMARNGRACCMWILPTLLTPVCDAAVSTGLR